MEGDTIMRYANPKDYYSIGFDWDKIEYARDNQRLLLLQIELSLDCNLRCIYCYRDSGEALRNELKIAEILHVIEQAHELGAEEVVIVGGGEPLLYNKIFDVLDFLHHNSQRITLFTNGTLINKETAKKLLDFSVSLEVKMNSRRPEIQDYLAGKRGAYQQIQKGIRNLLDIDYQDKANLAIESIICKYNIRELPEIWIWARKNSIMPLFDRLYPIGRKEKVDIDVSPEELETLVYRLNKIDREMFGFDWDISPPIPGIHCDKHYYSCLVDAQGYVQPCPGVTIRLGNIRNQPLADILRHKVIRDLRFIDRNITGTCKTCKYQKCYGCRGSAFRLTGDYLASDPQCWFNRNSKRKNCTTQPRKGKI